MYIFPLIPCLIESRLSDNAVYVSIRSISSIRDLATFRRFMALLATRCGQMLNKTDLAAPLGVSVPTITQWLNILEVTGQIILVPPFFENFGKRLVKTPKLYFVDSGLLCHLLGIPDEKTLKDSPFRGAVLEGYVAAEVTKHRLHRGRERGLYYFRDRQGLEVDFVLDQGNRKLMLLEVKSTRSPMPHDGQSMMQLLRNIKHYKASAFLIYSASGSQGKPSVLCEGIKAIGMRSFQSLL